MRKMRLGITIAVAALPGLGLAWTPYFPGAPVPPTYGGYPGGFGYPFASPAIPGVPGYGPRWPVSPFASGASQTSAATPPVGASAPAASERPFGAMPAHGRPAWPRLDVSRQVADDAYLIDIQVQNLDPKQVQVRPIPRGLLMTYDATSQVSRQGTLPGGEGYQSSYRFSRGTTSRRLALPSDAKLADMTREVNGDHIQIRVPRDASDWRGRW